MTSQDKFLSFALADGPNDWDKVQSQLLKNWHSSVDNAFDSFSQFFHFTSDTMNSLSRYQNENLNLYFDAHTERERETHTQRHTHKERHPL